MNDGNVSPTTLGDQQQIAAMQRFHEQLALVPDAPKKLDALARAINAVSDLRIILLTYNPDDAALEYACSYPVITPAPLIYIPLFKLPDDSALTEIKAGQHIILALKEAENRLRSLATAIGQGGRAALIPLAHEEVLDGVMVAYSFTEDAFDDAALSLLLSIAPTTDGYLRMIEKQLSLQKRKDDIEREAEIFSQIDTDLSDVIDLNYIFTMLQDWALRFTNADAAALSLYDSKANTLRVMSQYGFRPESITIGEELPAEQGGLTLRVANSGLPEIVPDVLVDSDYYEMVEGARTQMSVPVKREEQVIGVLVLYSRKVNGFTDEHLAFVKKLAARAGVAVDNARLFTETRREREKLSYILRNISEIVIVIGLDHRIVLINDSARLAFRLADDQDYSGQSFVEVIANKSVQNAYHQTIESGESFSSEIELSNQKTYHTTIENHAGVGHIIVMQDITHFKETDRLKTELVATVSHDLKQPLSVMRGYLDLLQMVNTFDERSQGYIGSLNYAFRTMRQLIDDLLDIARIEAGLTLDMEETSLTDILDRVLQNTKAPAEQKTIHLTFDLPDDLPIIEGDPSRLEQVFSNLVGNAIKYTPPEGKVRVYTEIRQNLLRIFVEDNGMGIGPEDQAQIFERFYRVRRPETESIEGTGLGLAIVKSLVEAHHGKIDLKSALGEGSTFRVTLPIP